MGFAITESTSVAVKNPIAPVKKNLVSFSGGGSSLDNNNNPGSLPVPPKKMVSFSGGFNMSAAPPVVEEASDAIETSSGVLVGESDDGGALFSTG